MSDEHHDALNVCSWACPEHIKVLHYWSFDWELNTWPVDSPHKGPVMWKALPCHDFNIKCGLLHNSWDILHFLGVWVCWLKSFLHHPDLSQAARHQYPADRTSPCLIPPNGYWMAIMEALVIMTTIIAWSLRKAEDIRNYWFNLSYIPVLPKHWQQLVL